MRNQAHQICHTNEIPRSNAKSFMVNGESIFIVNHDNKFYAYKNRCPHLELELEWDENNFLNNDQQLIQCANHGALFDISSGRCIEGPCAGATLMAFNIRIQNGKIYGEKAANPPC